MECKHTDTREHKAIRTVSGLDFSYSTRQCNKCHSVIWSHENEVTFHEWLMEQKRHHRDKFVLQKIHIPCDLMTFSEQIARARCTSVSNVYQAALACYFVYIPTKKGWQEILDGHVYTNSNSTSTISKLDVNPSMFLAIEANAKLFDLTASAVASWAISRVLQAALRAYQNTESEGEELALNVYSVINTALAA
jgi:hypothetical protein